MDIELEIWRQNRATYVIKNLDDYGELHELLWTNDKKIPNRPHCTMEGIIKSGLLTKELLTKEFKYTANLLINKAIKVDEDIYLITNDKSIVVKILGPNEFENYDNWKLNAFIFKTWNTLSIIEDYDTTILFNDEYEIYEAHDMINSCKSAGLLH
jgi:hypothetical protein